MNRNYLVIHPEQGQKDAYTTQMLSSNGISGFLPFCEKWVDGQCSYYYDITSRQPLSRMLEHRNLTGQELFSLMSGILFALKQMEKYLLDESYVSFSPENVHVDADSFQSFLCMIPGKEGDFSKEFRELCQYLLDHVNHHDGDAVVLAFSIVRECRKENFGILPSC